MRVRSQPRLPLGTERPDLVRTPGGHRAGRARAARRTSRRASCARRPRRCVCRRTSRAPPGGRSSPRTCCARPSWPPLPDETILELYTALRPRRSTAAELEAWARQLESWEAPRTAAFVREAARGLRAQGPACNLTSAPPASSRASSAGCAASCSIEPLAELGLVAMNGPNDPEWSLVIEGDAVVELDGRREAEWDALDHFVVRHGLDLEVAREAAALEDVEIARALVDVDVSRAELVRLSRGLTPARLARVIALLDPVELMFALKKLRARRAPANQAHVTNLKENPALLAADAAEAAARGFAEVETTVGVSRYAPLNAIAILVGSQTGRSGRDDAVRGRGAAQPPARDAGPRAPTPRRSPCTARRRSSSTATTRPGRRPSSRRPTPRAGSRCASRRAPAPRR